MFKKHDRKKEKMIQLCFPTQILRWFSGGSDKTSVNVPIGIYSWKLLSMLTANTTGSPYKKHKKVIWLCTLTELITEIRHCPEFLKLTFRASTPSSVRREGLTLKTLVSETFYGGQCTFINSIDRLSHYQSWREKLWRGGGEGEVVRLGRRGLFLYQKSCSCIYIVFSYHLIYPFLPLHGMYHSLC